MRPLFFSLSKNVWVVESIRVDVYLNLEVSSGRTDRIFKTWLDSIIHEVLVKTLMILSHQIRKIKAISRQQTKQKKNIEAGTSLGPDGSKIFILISFPLGHFY